MAVMKELDDFTQQKGVPEDPEITRRVEEEKRATLRRYQEVWGSGKHETEKPSVEKH